MLHNVLVSGLRLVVTHGSTAAYILALALQRMCSIRASQSLGSVRRRPASRMNRIVRDEGHSRCDTREDPRP